MLNQVGILLKKVNKAKVSSILGPKIWLKELSPNLKLANGERRNREQ